MAKYVFPAVFVKDNTGIAVDFPDLESCYTSGADMFRALEMAADVLALTLCRYEDTKKYIPEASAVGAINAGKDDIISLVPADTVLYRQNMGNINASLVYGF